MLVLFVALGLLAAALISPQAGPDEPEPADGGSAPLYGFTNTAHHPPALAPGAQVAASQAAITPGGVMRFSIQWRLAQPAPDAPIDLDAINREVVQPALKEKLKPLIVVTAAPEWAWGEGTCDPRLRGPRSFCFMPPGSDGASLAAWRAFVEEVARRFGDDAAAIEVWNEENGGGFWNETGGPDPSQYAEVLCAAHDAVREVDKRVPVLLGGLGAQPTDATHDGPADFLTALYEDPSHDVRRCMDAVAVHPYPRQRPVSALDSSFDSVLADVRAVRDSHEDPGRKLWLTEFGYWSHGSGGVGDEAQAEMLACAASAAAAAPDIEAFVIHDLIDRPALGPATGSYGVYRVQADGAIAPKPAALVLKRLLAHEPAPASYTCEEAQG